MRENSDQKFCGNCGNHNAYDYPLKVFCGKRLAEGKNPVIETLSCCGDWNPSGQECYCVKEALKNNEREVIKSSRSRQ